MIYSLDQANPLTPATDVIDDNVMDRDLATLVQIAIDAGKVDDLRNDWRRVRTALGEPLPRSCLPCSPCNPKTRPRAAFGP